MKRAVAVLVVSGLAVLGAACGGKDRKLTPAQRHREQTKEATTHGRDLEEAKITLLDGRTVTCVVAYQENPDTGSSEVSAVSCDWAPQ